MGKSLKNAVTPDDIYAAYGADTLRLYEMAMGPLDADRPWQTDDMVGVYRFLQRLWRNIVDEQTGELLVRTSRSTTRPSACCTARSRSCGGTCGELRFNTAIARLIELNNHASQAGRGSRMDPRPGWPSRWS